MTWDADTFTELIMEPDSIPDLLARLVALPEADRTSTRRAFGKALPELRRRLRTPDGGSGLRPAQLGIPSGAGWPSAPSS